MLNARIEILFGALRLGQEGVEEEMGMSSLYVRVIRLRCMTDKC